jgi:hypothetical protein
MTDTELEQLRLNAHDYAKALVELTTYLASQEFRRDVNLDEAYAITEQLCSTATAHFQMLRRIELAEREMAE